jgi:hypothetical protein
VDGQQRDVVGPALGDRRTVAALAEAGLSGTLPLTSVDR